MAPINVFPIMHLLSPQRISPPKQRARPGFPSLHWRRKSLRDITFLSAGITHSETTSSIIGGYLALTIPAFWEWIQPLRVGILWLAVSPLWQPFYGGTCSQNSNNAHKLNGLRSGRPRFESLLCYRSSLGDLGPVIHTQPNLLHRIAVKKKMEENDVIHFGFPLGRKAGCKRSKVT